MTHFLAQAPFHLSPDDIAWVVRTRDALTAEQKVRQLFVLAQLRDLPHEVPEVMRHRPGGVHRAWGPDLTTAWQTTRAVLEADADVPPLITGDLEGGAYSSGCGTPLPNALGLCAADSLDLSAAVTGVLAQESRAMGFDWSFTPVVDINHKLESAIVGTRSFGSDPQRILAQARVHVREMQAAGLATTAKHWPGEGFDFRDQHLVTTVNPLDWDTWLATFAPLYRTLIDDGVLSVMSAHIALPAAVERLRPGAGRDGWRPASVSRELNTLLLRDTLGFNGVIVSDATPMAGFTSWAERAEMVPQVIEHGCDVFLFTLDTEEDIALMLRGLREGRLSETRLEAAVTRVLGLKARLGLHRRSIDERLAPLEQVQARLRKPEHQAVAQAAAKASVTLVKDSCSTLPLSPQRHRRVVVISPGIETHWANAQPAPLRTLLDGLTARGFELRAYDPQHLPTPADTDLVLYLLAKESMLGRSRLFLDWAQLHGDPRKAMRRFWPALPTVMVSFGHAAYLMDAPRLPTYINAYTATEPTQQAVLRKLLGEEPFSGRSPIDAFCGQPEAHW